MFPETGLTHRLDLVRYVADGTDAEDNPKVAPTTPVFRRKCRRYRDRQLESAYVRDGRNVSGVVACKFRDGDDFRESDELLVYRVDEHGLPYEKVTLTVVYPKLYDGVKRPSHWEIVVSEVRSA